MPDPVVSPQEGDYCFSSLLLLNDQDFKHVHPADVYAVRANYPHGWQLLCFRYGGRQDGYDVLDDGNMPIRVRGAFIAKIPEPVFKRGQSVFAHRKQQVGIIRVIVWHYTRQQVYYRVEFAGRLSGFWYFNEDLEAVNAF